MCIFAGMRILAKIYFLTALIFAGGCVTETDEPAASLVPGSEVPQFEVMLSDGSSWSTMSLRGVGVIAFFNTGCADCRRELPELQRAYEACCERAEFVCIAREESGEEIAAYWEAEGLTLPYSPQSDRAVYSLFASSGIPRIYVVAPSGRIHAVFSDASPSTAAEIEAAVDAALRAKS